MRAEPVRHFCKDISGAISPMYAIAIFALVAIAGIGFDYGRLAALDTELQNAADQAALAAATQLDGKPDAMKRARDAARTNFTNETRFANERGMTAADRRPVTMDDSGFKFYDGYSGDQPGNEIAYSVTGGANVKVVEVTVNARTAYFALTPVVGAIAGGSTLSRAMAGVDRAICEVPPLMICNPNENSGGAFPNASDRGRGLKLEAGGGGAWAPGNYGYLDFGNGARALTEALGANSDQALCLNLSTVNTKPGNTASATAGINTRFDIYESGLPAYCAPGSGNCGPAMNTRKDLVHAAISNGNGNGNGNGNAPNCALTGNDPWTLPSVQYLGVSTPTPTNMGLPRDVCHSISSNGTCLGGRFGDGNWDRALYFQVNHNGISPSVAQTWAGRATLAELSRYDVYQWELATSKTSARLAYSTTGKKPVDMYSYSAPQCAAGIPSSNTQKDRRLLTVAVVDCAANGVSGSTPIKSVRSWVDMFLVEPSINRQYTSADQIYVEVVGPSKKADSSSSFQYYGRNKVVLIR